MLATSCSEFCQTSKMKLFIQTISKFQPLTNSSKKPHLRCLIGSWISLWASIFGNWFLESLIPFSYNPFISGGCLLLNVKFLLATLLQSEVNSLYATIIKFHCSPSFDCILHLLNSNIHNNQELYIFSFIAASCTQWHYKTVLLYVCYSLLLPSCAIHIFYMTPCLVYIFW